jgi:hypothetical protein
MIRPSRGDRNMDEQRILIIVHKLQTAIDAVAHEYANRKGRMLTAIEYLELIVDMADDQLMLMQPFDNES